MLLDLLLLIPASMSARRGSQFGLMGLLKVWCDAGWNAKPRWVLIFGHGVPDFADCFDQQEQEPQEPLLQEGAQRWARGSSP